MNDKVLIEIMAKKSTKVYQSWLKDRGKKVEPNQNLRVSKIIDRLNNNIDKSKIDKFINDKDVDENSDTFCQLTFDFE